MEESEQRIRNELLEHMKKWNDELQAGRRGFMGSAQILARALLWGAARVTTSSIQAVRPRGMTVDRLEFEGPTQKEQDAFISKQQEIFDRLWSVVQYERPWNEHIGEEW